MNDFFLISHIETYESIPEHRVYNTKLHISIIKYTRTCIIDYVYLIIMISFTTLGLVHSML